VDDVTSALLRAPVLMMAAIVVSLSMMDGGKQKR
jgi:hypothetical protein